MNIEFNCPHCDRSLAIDEKWRDMEVQCPDCSGSLVPTRVIAKKKDVEQAREKYQETPQNIQREEEERAERKEVLRLRKLQILEDNGLVKIS